MKQTSTPTAWTPALILGFGIVTILLLIGLAPGISTAQTVYPTPDLPDRPTIEPPTSVPTADTPTDEPATAEPTDEPATTEPTDEPDDPTSTAMPDPTNTPRSGGGGGRSGGSDDDDDDDDAIAAPGRVTGTVIDQRTGAPVPGVQVQVGDQVVVTDENGNYITEPLPPGTYTVVVQPTAEQGVPQQEPVTVIVESGEVAVQHLFIASGPLVASPTPVGTTGTTFTSMPLADALATPIATPIATPTPANIPAALPDTSGGSPPAVPFSIVSLWGGVLLLLVTLLLLWWRNQTGANRS